MTIFLLASLCTFHLAKASPQGLQGTLDSWQVSIDGGQTFQTISGSAAVEDHVDADFDGVSIYKTDLPDLELSSSQRLVITFEGIATDAKVHVAGQPVGEHLGAWTPFSMDVTEEYTAAQSAGRNVELKVEVDEKVGHNTQGFLPIVTNHFGGIWKPVAWELHGDGSIVEQAMTIRLESDRRGIQLEMPIRNKDKTNCAVQCDIRKLQQFSSDPNSDWQPLELQTIEFIESDRTYTQSSTEQYQERHASARFDLPFELEPWSMAKPTRYEFRIQLFQKNEQPQGGRLLDEATLRMGFRDFEVEGEKFLLNGNPVNIRGLLNWGYAPPLVSPSQDESFMRKELEFARERGFNMMKFCLWVPPRRYLELCDEMGMLAWMEYPTWHPKLDQEHLPELKREYAEFYEYDRNHCSIVLRSLTCETGPSAELEVIQSLYDQCKTFIPDAVLEDDSSWIQWNRVHDFYDDHPYGNNHTWIATLDRLKQYIAERETKPLVLGEAIAADTWVRPTDQALQLSASAPHHGPISIVDAQRWMEQLAKVAERNGRVFDPGSLTPQSRHYGMLMRKYQIEAYQREVPNGVYVVSVIRDFRKAHMGLIDYFGNAKHRPADWSFQNDRMILLQTERDHRSIQSGSVVEWQFHSKNGSMEPTKPSTVTVSLNLPHDDMIEKLPDELKFDIPELLAGQIAVNRFDFTVPQVERPIRALIQARWKIGQDAYTNEWPIWIFPKSDQRIEMIVHPSAADLVNQLPVTPIEWSKSSLESVPRGPVLTRRIDAELLTELQNGRKVFMIPDGQSGSLPLSSHWFLRGGPVTLPSNPDSWDVSFTQRRGETAEQQNMLCELQHFDLAGDVIPNIDHYLESIDPAFVLWDNHDRDVVNTHGLVFKMPVGNGVILASALNHTDSAAGTWLFHQLVNELHVAAPIQQQMGEANLQRLSLEVNRQQLNLTTSEWQFRPDPDVVGENQGWQRPGLADDDWSQIRIDSHWEGQGHAALDHWAWYRKAVAIPDDWKSDTAYLNFTGIDDYADIYVNGSKVGSAGDIEQKRTAFEDRLSFDISEFVKPGETIQIAVAVYDWYGAGGIFRPVTLSTIPLSTDPPILK